MHRDGSCEQHPSDFESINSMLSLTVQESHELCSHLLYLNHLEFNGSDLLASCPSLLHLVLRDSATDKLSLGP